MKFIGETTVTILLLGIGSIINAFVIMKLWNWLLVPSFDIEPIGMAIAFAVSVVKGYFLLRQSEGTSKESYWEKIIGSFVFLIVLAVMYLLMGFIASLFI